jgi:hypothetical protein
VTARFIQYHCAANCYFTPVILMDDVGRSAPIIIHQNKKVTEPGE